MASVSSGTAHPVFAEQYSLKSFSDQLSELSFSCEKEQDNNALKYRDFQTKLASNEIQTYIRFENLRGQIREIQNTFHEYQLNELHQQADNISNLGNNSLKVLQLSTAQVINQLESSCKRWRLSAIKTVNNLSKTYASVNLSGMNEIIEKQKSILNNTTQKFDKNIACAIHQFHWKNFLLCLWLSFIMTFVMIYNLDNVWPWEKRAQIIKQRHEGQALINAWSQLSQLDQQIIENYV